MKPIIFSTAMVQAILKGWKTQTRRIIIPQPINSNKAFQQIDKWFFPDAYYCDEEHPDIGEYKEPKYKVNDILYVRESFCPNYFYNGNPGFKSDYTKNAKDYVPEPKWKPSIFMPKKIARIFLKITNIKCERLQSISGDDCHAEGMRIFLKDEDSEDPYYEVPAYWKNPDGKIIKRLLVDSIFDCFFNLWDSINYKRGYGWGTNPYVFAYTFERDLKK